MLYTNGGKGKILFMVNKVKQRRRAKGMKQDELASRVGIGQSTLSQIESGKNVPGVNIAIRISKVLKCRVEDLFDEQEEWKDKVRQ